MALGAAALAAVALFAIGGGRGGDGLSPVAPLEDATARGPDRDSPRAVPARDREPDVSADAGDRDSEGGGRVAGPWGSDWPQRVVEVVAGSRVEIHDSPGGAVVARAGAKGELGSTSAYWVRRRSGEWLGVPTPEMPNGELGWIRGTPGPLRDHFVDDALLVDLSERRASHFEAGEEVRGWTVSIGSSETPTPTGRFAVTDTFRGGLNPVYGCCALALTATQGSLPDYWPGGDRIAFHGTEGPLGEAISNGCLRSSDAVLRELVGEVPIGTPVLIRE